MIDASVRARGLGISTTYEPKSPNGALFLPQRVALFAQGNTANTYALTKFQAFRHTDVANVMGYGSLVHLAARELLPDNGDGLGAVPLIIYPLADGGTAATASITPSGTLTLPFTGKVGINGIYSTEFTVAAGASVAVRTAALTAAVGSVLHMPMTAVDGTTVTNLTAKWKGLTGNDLKIEVVGTTGTGAVWTISQPTGGATNPSIQQAVDQIGSDWISMIVLALGNSDTTALDILSTWNEGRWLDGVRKPAVAFVGSNTASPTTAVTVTDARKTDRTNVQLTAPGSKNHPVVIAARQVARIARVANQDPAMDYGGQAATGLIPGTDAEQWTSTQRDTAMKAGSSTSELIDGVVTVSDVVTMYHPTGETDPAYRYVCDIVKLQSVIYNFDAEFRKPEWNGAPLIPDDQPTTNKNARKPMAVKTKAFQILDKLGLAAIITDVETSKELTDAGISTTNPKRWDLSVPIYLSGNGNVRSISLSWSFAYGA